MKNHSDYPWPAPVVIGLTSVGDLTFLPEEYAVGAAEEIDRWRRASTWGEARDLAARAHFVEPPFLPDDLTGSEAGSAAFVVGDLGVVADGDWPPSAQTLSLVLVQARWSNGEAFGVGTEVDTVFNGPILMISADEDHALRHALEQAGCSVRRDDDLIRRAGEM